MRRNKTIDIFRALALLSVLIYHFYVICGEPFSGNRIMNRFLGIGGELGVTLFFIISGFGIYCSLSSMERRDGFLKERDFLKRRLLRILPQYYANIFILIVLTSGQYLSKTGFFSILAHILLIHNWFPSTHGSINGVLWSMGTIFQFYFIAVVMYKAVKWNKWTTYVGSVLLCIISKAIIFHYILPTVTDNAMWNFIYARQIFTALDNFILGMLLGDIMKKQGKDISGRLLFSGGILIFAFCAFWLGLTEVYSPYADSFFGYVWHSVLALGLSCFMYCVCKMDFSFDGVLGRILIWISKYQYGTYIWHLVAISALLTNSSWVQKTVSISFWLFAVLATIGSCLIGFLSTICFENVGYKEKLLELKKDLLIGSK